MEQLHYSQKPAGDSGVKAISIVGICLGSAALLIDSIFILLAVLMTTAAQNQGRPFSNSAPLIDILLKLVFIVLALGLVIGSIGCFMRKEWARKMLLGYALIYPLALVMDLVRTASAIGPMTTTTYGPGGVAHTTTMNNSGVGLTVIVPSVFLDILLIILPVFILIQLRKPGVQVLFTVNPERDVL